MMRAFAAVSFWIGALASGVLAGQVALHLDGLAWLAGLLVAIAIAVMSYADLETRTV